MREQFLNRIATAVSFLALYLIHVLDPQRRRPMALLLLLHPLPEFQLLSISLAETAFAGVADEGARFLDHLLDAFHGAV
jgi:hypothetical protein